LVGLISVTLSATLLWTYHSPDGTSYFLSWVSTSNQKAHLTVSWSLRRRSELLAVGNSCAGVFPQLLCHLFSILHLSFLWERGRVHCEEEGQVKLQEQKIICHLSRTACIQLVSLLLDIVILFCHKVSINDFSLGINMVVRVVV
jgi:hypothetical protein